MLVSPTRKSTLSWKAERLIIFRDPLYVTQITEQGKWNLARWEELLPAAVDARIQVDDIQKVMLVQTKNRIAKQH